MYEVQTNRWVHFLMQFARLHGVIYRNRVSCIGGLLNINFIII